MKKFILFASAMFLLSAPGLLSGELDDEVAEPMRKANSAEAAKMLEQAERYLKMETRDAKKAAKFLFNEVAKLYPDTAQAETAKKRLEELGMPFRPLTEEEKREQEQRRRHLERELRRAPSIPPREAWEEIFREPYSPPPAGEQWLPKIYPKPSNLNDC